MYLFAHLGLGYLAVKPWWRRVPTVPLLVGTLFPDLLDKPLYYIASAWTGEKGAAIGLLSGTRTFGHTALLLLVIFALTSLGGWKARGGFCLGIATHLLFDNLGDYFAGGGVFNLQALLWPLEGWAFPEMPYPSFRAQLGHWLDSRQLLLEVAGLGVLIAVAVMARRKRPA